MARAALAAGIRTMTATPHIDHTFGVDPREIPQRVSRLRASLQDAGIDLDVRQGGEVAVSRLLELDEESLACVHLGDGRHLLVEPPFNNPVPGLEHLVFDLQSRGHAVLIAHPERCRATADVERALVLAGRGALMQVTASSLLGKFGGTVRRTAVEMLRRGVVQVISSDAHGAASRSMDLARAVESVESDLPGISQLTEYLTETAPAAVLAGEAIPPPPAWDAPEAPRRGWLRRR